jgi:hypothetical protein
MITLITTSSRSWVQNREVALSPIDYMCYFLAVMALRRQNNHVAAAISGAFCIMFPRSLLK